MTDYLLENGIKSAVFWVVGLVAVWIGVMLFAPFYFNGSFPSVSQSKWQAVFLSNNQVYFGKLQNINSAYVALSDVYYLQTAGDLQAEGASAKLNLIKLGGEVHGPEDTIYVPKSSILFWENMKDSSRVVQTIQSTKQ